VKFVPFNKRKPLTPMTRLKMQRAHYEATALKQGEVPKVTLKAPPWEAKDETDTEDS
jgi:hypothetical protein